MMDLAQVIADWREELAVLRANKATMPVDRIEERIADVCTAAEDFLLFLSEGDAMVRRGITNPAWLRARFPEWERAGHARMVGRQRQYRALIIPRRANTIAAAGRGREAARQSA